MKKKVQHKHKKKTTAQHSHVAHYIKVYFYTVAVGLIFFIAGWAFLPHTPCANSQTCQTDLSINIDNNATGMFQGHVVRPPKVELTYRDTASVLGINDSSEEKHIYVDLSAQKLYAYQGTDKIMETFISSGKWGPTPVGNFHIWEKLRATRMAGGEGADAYDLPNVPYVMYFYSDFGLHGAYWHNNFGHPMSHGCVNMRIVDARDLYNWADGPTSGHPGTAVSVCNSFSQPNTCIQNNPVN